MTNDKRIETLYAVINTINATNLRADQVEAVNRLNACVRTLMGIAQEMQASMTEGATTDKEGT